MSPTTPHMIGRDEQTKQREDGVQTGQVCACCGKEPLWRWTDRHGVAVCNHCGLPYTIYHYDGNKRVDRPPEVAIQEWFVPFCVRYFNETGRRVVPGSFDFLRARGSESYSGATIENVEKWNQWCDEHKAEIDASETIADAMIAQRSKP